MGVISDEVLEASAMVDGGVSAGYRGSQYDFRAGVVYPCGHDEQGRCRPSINLGAEGPYPVGPGEIVLVGTIEVVRMPRNRCGLWLPRNELAQQGLMLLNPTLVPAGFEGSLVCALANFGSQAIYLSAGERLAHLVVLPIEGEVRSASSAYTEETLNIWRRTAAAKLPKSFLKVGELKAELKAGQQEAEGRIKHAADEELQRVVRELRSQYETIRGEQAQRFGEDLRGQLLSAAKPALLLVAFLGLAWGIANGLVRPYVSKWWHEREEHRSQAIAADLAKALGTDPQFDRVADGVYVYRGKVAEDPTVQELESRLTALEKQVEADASGAGP